MSVWLAVFAPPAYSEDLPGRWTIEAIAAAPEITDLSVAADGASVLFILRRGDVAADRTLFELYHQDVRTERRRLLTTSAFMSQLSRDPAGSGWTMLLDRGSVELFRISETGNMRRFVSSPARLTLGAIDGAAGSTDMESPREVSVLSYLWSPDGQALFYVRASNEIPAPSALFNEDIWDRVGTSHFSPRWVQYRVRLRNGDDRMLGATLTSDPAALENGAAQWSDDGAYIRYVIEGEEHVRALFVGVQTFSPALVGPRGGRLEVRGYGDARRLIEQMPDAGTLDYGPFRARVQMAWRSSATARVVVSARHARALPYHGLIVLEAGEQRAISHEGSLTECDFTPRLDEGVCVQHSVTTPPRLIRVNVEAGEIAPLGDAIAPDLERIEPLRVETLGWRDTQNRPGSGYVILPRVYNGAGRYPLLVVTHGGDADDRFLNRALQWEYPVQVFAELGYFVLAVNDPSPGEDEALAQAYAAWTSPHPRLDPSILQRALWDDSIANIAQAIDALATIAPIDRDRMAIAGYSRGAQIVNVAMTQTGLFAAGSSGDGGYLEPSGYLASDWLRRSYDNVFGGAPYEAAAADAYRNLSPTFRAAHASGPLLQQIAALHPAHLEFHYALRRAGIKAQMSLYAGARPNENETHLFNRPANRLAAMQENMDWFEFWLRDVRNPNARARQYESWDFAEAPEQTGDD